LQEARLKVEALGAAAHRGGQVAMEAVNLKKCQKVMTCRVVQTRVVVLLAKGALQKAEAPKARGETLQAEALQARGETLRAGTLKAQGEALKAWGEDLMAKEVGLQAKEEPLQADSLMGGRLVEDLVGPCHLPSPPLPPYYPYRPTSSSSTPYQLAPIHGLQALPPCSPQNTREP